MLSFKDQFQKAQGDLLFLLCKAKSPFQKNVEKFLRTNKKPGFFGRADNL
jgi:hypothetical protein